MRRTVLLALALCLLAATPAAAASTFTIRGAGFGHGIGLSQYGAMGMARQGWDHERILGHYFSGTRLGQAPAGTVVRVLMQSPNVARFTGATKAGTRPVRPERTYGVARGAGGTVRLLSPTGRTLATFDPPLTVTNGESGPVKLLGAAGNGVSDGAYRGWFEFRPGTLGGVLAINAVSLDQYVAGVVAGEMPASWPAEALASQAVAARTYAITTSRAGQQGWDQYPDTRSQVYKGIAGEHPSTNAAVNATSGQVVTYDGKPVTTFYFSTSGGRTESVENSFIGAPPRPWLRSVDDPYDDASPYHRWGPITMSLSAAGAKLGDLVKGSFRGIEVQRRGGSPRIVAAEIVGTRGRTKVSGPQLRARFGLRDSWMTFNSLSAEVEGPARGDGTAPSGGAVASRNGRVTGSAFPGRPGAAVVLEKRTGGSWRRVGGTRLGTTHRFKVGLAGPGTYRVVVDGAIGPTLRAR